MDLAQAGKSLVIRSPFYGHLSLGLQKHFSTSVPTACATIRGINVELHFNEVFWNKLSDKHQIGLLEHELGHVALFHLINFWDYDDKELANIASDLVINQYIEADYLPPGGMTLASFPNIPLEKFKDTRYYYDELKKNANSKDGDPKLKALLAAMKGGKMVVCSHPLWEENQDETVGGMNSETLRELAGKQIEHQIKQVYEENLNKNPGNLPGYLRDFVNNLYTKTPPIVDWRVVVRQFKSFCDKQLIKTTRTKPNKRFPEFDAVTLRQKQRMLVGIDTSGSISPQLLTEFFTQILHIHRTGTEVDVCEWDARVGRVFAFDKNKQFEMSQITGGGGTNPYDFVELLNKSPKYNAAISMTDGYIGGSWEKMSKPILWLSNGNLNFSFPGKKILVNL